MFLLALDVFPASAFRRLYPLHLVHRARPCGAWSWRRPSDRSAGICPSTTAPRCRTAQEGAGVLGAGSAETESLQKPECLLDYRRQGRRFKFKLPEANCFPSHLRQENSDCFFSIWGRFLAKCPQQKERKGEHHGSSTVFFRPFQRKFPFPGFPFSAWTQVLGGPTLRAEVGHCGGEVDLDPRLTVFTHNAGVCLDARHMMVDKSHLSADFYCLSLI